MNNYRNWITAGVIIVTVLAVTFILNKQTADEALMSFNIGGNHYYYIQSGESARAFLGGAVLIYLETNDNLYYIGDEIQSLLGLDDTKVTGDSANYYYQKRYFKINLNRLDFEAGDTVSEFNNEDIAVFNLLETELINRLAGGKIFMTTDGELMMSGLSEIPLEYYEYNNTEIIGFTAVADENTEIDYESFFMYKDEGAE